MNNKPGYIEVGYGTGKGKNAFEVGAEAARLSTKDITSYPLSVLIVFASSGYNLKDLLSGIASVVGDVPIIGTTTAGEICNEPLQGSVVISALASPYLQVRTGVGKNVSEDYRKAVEEAISSKEILPYFSDTRIDYRQKLTRQGKTIFSIIFSPGNTRHADARGFGILKQLQQLSDGRIPFFGGGAADDWKMDANYILHGTEAYPDSLLVAVFETSLRVGMAMGHGFSPSEKRALATHVNGYEVIALNGRPAAETYASMLNRDVQELKGKHLTLETGRPSGIRDMLDQYRIVVASYLTPEGGVRFTQPIPENSTITIMDSQPDKLIEAGRETLRKALLQGQIHKPVVALVFSCALRQRILKDRSPMEIEAIRSLLPELPVVGFYSFGEQGITDAGINCHGNEKITTLVLGDELTASAEVAIENQQLLKQQRENEMLINAIVENIPNMIFVKDAKNLRFKIFNKAGEDLLGYSRTEMIGKNDYDFFPKHEADFFTEKDRETLENVTLVDIPEERILTKLKGERFLHTKKIPLLDQNGHAEYLLGISEDITERKQAEQKLRESEEKLVRYKKMESLGLMAGGVAHDLNNILSGIVTYPELLLLNLPQGNPLRKPIETIQACGNKATAIVQDLLTIARGVAIEKQPLNLNDMINSYLTSPEHLKIIQYHPDVTVKLALEDQLLNIKGSAPHISKILMNLVANACEAIDGTGTVVLKTANRYVDLPLKGYNDMTVGEYAVLVIEDNGPGIQSEDLNRIFEPFYSKKVMGRSGTGLGLAVVWNVVQDHQGYINVLGEDNGTTFELYFPITREELWQKDVPLSIEDYKGHGESILVVDDEDSQREIFFSMLTMLGYRVETVDGGEAAVDYLKAHSVDLVILDMIMAPGINGRETYEQILKIHPDQKAIIVSGFAETDDVKKTHQLGAGRYIKKPVQMEKIGLAIQQALNASIV